jgi:hypothetical protein
MSKLPEARSTNIIIPTLCNYQRRSYRPLNRDAWRGYTLLSSHRACSAAHGHLFI